MNNLASSMHRRLFLKVLGLTSLGLAIPSFVIPSGAVAGNKEMLTQTRLFMGTFVTIKIQHTSKDFAMESMATAFDIIKNFESVLSRHDSASPLSQLNATGSLKDAPSSLQYVVQNALTIGKQTNQSFDITVLPLLEILEANSNKVLSAKEIAEARSLMGQEAVAIKNQTISLERTGMKLTLDAIAKGYIVDAASEYLISQGIDAFLIDAGGDIRLHGNRENSQNATWQVAVQDPHGKEQYPVVLALTNAAIATSGSYEKTFASGHHILYTSGNELSPSVLSATVIAPTAMEADALATAISIMPIPQALAHINALPNRACMVIDANSAMHTSKAWTA